MLIKTSENRPKPSESKSSERLTTSIPEYTLKYGNKREVLDRHAEVGKFQAGRKIDYEKVDGAVVMKQFIGERTLKFSTSAFRRGWDRIWGKA